jgi:hypothetical protein
MNDTTIQSDASTDATESSTPTSEQRVSRFSSLKLKFGNFLKTKRGKAFIFLLILIVLAGAAGTVYLSRQKPTEPDVIVSETIASDKIYDNFDFIYNSEDNKLIASTADRLKQLELVSGEEKIVDYIISPDKRKILYSLSSSEYKSRIVSPNADLTKFIFSPVAFKIYELNLETGENKLIWSVDKYDVGATTQQLYNKKTVVYPDSYAVSEINGIPYSYPISNVQVENDIEAGYNSVYLPYDISETLRMKSIKLISYNSLSDKLIFSVEGGLVMYNLSDSTTKDIKFEEHGCYANSGSWVGEIMVMNVRCDSGYSEKRFTLNGDTLNEIDIHLGLGGPLTAILTKPDYTLAIMHPPTYPRTFKPSLNILDFNTKVTTNIVDLVDNEDFISIETIGSQSDIVASKLPLETERFWSEATYTFFEYNKETNSLVKLQQMVLPYDIYNIAYNTNSNSLSYYRTYRASTESIIEYRIMDLATQADQELLTIKVDNDSVLYYKPKLVWFDVEQD